MTDNLPTSENQPQRSQPSTLVPTSLSEAQAALSPAPAKAGTAELMACLTLVAPSGMTAEDRTAWVAVARQTLSGIPGDLLQRGCRVARETCRFPSEIVPAILEEVRWAWDNRKSALARCQPQYRLPTPQPEPEYVSAQAIGKLIKQLSRG